MRIAPTNVCALWVAFVVLVRISPTHVGALWVAFVVLVRISPTYVGALWVAFVVHVRIAPTHVGALWVARIYPETPILSRESGTDRARLFNSYHLPFIPHDHALL